MEEFNEKEVEVLVCSECGSQVSEEDRVCLNCGNPLSFHAESTDDEILENIEMIKEAATTVNILLKGIAVILFFVSFVYLFQYGSGPAIALSFCVMGIILLIASGFIKTFIKWKAYMLETNYNILKNVERDKNGSN